MKDYEMIKHCEDIAASDSDLHYFVIAGNGSVCSTSFSDDVDTLAQMFAMEFEERSEILAAVVKALAILEGVDELLHS